MSGHSKWHSIRHKKAAIDAKRGKLFTRIIRELTIAARMGGGDAGGNPRLRTAIQAAKDVNMPSKNIDSAIKKGTGELEGVNYEELNYEGYGPGGVALLIESTTDNRNRTTGEIRHILSKHGGSLGSVGCVSYLFQMTGLIILPRQGQDEDAILETALEAGADDVKSDDSFYTVSCQPTLVPDIRQALESKGFKVESAEVANIPTTTKSLDGKEAEMCLKLMSLLEDLDDVKSVSANFDISDEMIEQFQ